VAGELDSWATASATCCSGDVRAAFLAALGEAGGVRRLARRWRLSPAFISDVHLGRRHYGPHILKRLGFKAVRHPPTYSYERVP
jgi:hypothetical protein